MRYAISDLHGCPKTFEHLLREIDLRKTDELFLLGDYVDRGPDSIGVVNKIQSLRSEGYQVHCLRGNHEQMLIDALEAGQYPWDYRPDPADAGWLLPWMQQLPHYLETPGYVLVHAGLDFSRPDPLEDTEAMLWARHWYDTLDRGWLGDRILVHGHTPEVMLDIRRGIDEMTFAQRVCIDSGCAMNREGMGYLTALNLDTREGTFVRRLD